MDLTPPAPVSVSERGENDWRPLPRSAPEGGPGGEIHAATVGGEAPGEVWLLDLGRVAYGAAYELQRRLLAERDADRLSDLLLLVEHPPTITLGRRGSRDHVFVSDDELAVRGIAIHETNRGGLVTYHGPGQVVGYPVARLRPLAGDAPTYVWRLEETIIRALADLGVAAWRVSAHRGVFAKGGKIAAIGVAVTHGITMHGFALNVCPDLGHFALIDPCGIGELGVTSVERILGAVPDRGVARARLAEQFGRVFGRAVTPAPPALWELIGSWGLLEAAPDPVEIRLNYS